MKKRTLADDLASDPRITEAGNRLLQVLAEYQRHIKEIVPPDPELTVSYEQTLDQFGSIRGAPLFFPYLGSGIGNGPLVELADGSVKYDFISGIGVHHWGHGHPAMVRAALEAALRDTVMQGNLQQTVETVGLSRLLLEGANRHGAGLKHCFISSSGAMANENALKAIFQKMCPANRLLAFEGCFAGRTLALSQVTDKPAFREGLPPLLAVDYIPFFDAADPVRSTQTSVEHLCRYLERYPGSHAAMIFELVLGEGGYFPGSPEFFEALMDILRQNNVPIMVDEIQTFARTTELFAFQYYGLDRFVDVVTVGKSLQVCATLFREEFNPRPGLLSQTFTASTSAIFAAQVVLHGLMKDDYLGPSGTIAQLHDHFIKRLKAIRDRRPALISGPFGIGAMIAFTPFQGEPGRVKAFVRALFDNGVIAFYAGRDLLRVRFLMPVASVTFQDIDNVAAIIEDTLVQQS